MMQPRQQHQYQGHWSSLRCNGCWRRCLYRDFRGGGYASFQEAQQDLWVASASPETWKYKSRGVVLGRMHAAKKEAWEHFTSYCPHWGEPGLRDPILKKPLGRLLRRLVSTAGKPTWLEPARWSAWTVLDAESATSLCIGRLFRWEAPKHQYCVQWVSGAGGMRGQVMGTILWDRPGSVAPRVAEAINSAWYKYRNNLDSPLRGSLSCLKTLEDTDGHRKPIDSEHPAVSRRKAAHAAGNG